MVCRHRGLPTTNVQELMRVPVRKKFTEGDGCWRLHLASLSDGVVLPKSPCVAFEAGPNHLCIRIINFAAPGMHCCCSKYILSTISWQCSGAQGYVVSQTLLHTPSSKRFLLQIALGVFSTLDMLLQGLCHQFPHWQSHQHGAVNLLKAAGPGV